uniref:MIF4G domain-containing protein n=2 Tax=Amphimedon queenslandica TaxID=400682 RepID=A0A1X7U5N9_AMPQE
SVYYLKTRFKMATAVLPARHDSYESYYSEEEDDNRIRSTVTALKQPEKRKRSPSPDTREDASRDDDGASEWVEKKRKKDDDSILTKTGGAYIPPARLRMMQAQITDKTSAPYQRMAWEALKKSINGLINKVNISNIADIVRELFQENIVRGRGLLARSVISAQSASPTFTHVYAALVAIINTKFPQIGELIGKRLIITFQRAFKRNDKKICLSSVRFIAHLVNQQVDMLYELENDLKELSFYAVETNDTIEIHTI